MLILIFLFLPFSLSHAATECVYEDYGLSVLWNSACQAGVLTGLNPISLAEEYIAHHNTCLPDHVRTGSNYTYNSTLHYVDFHRIGIEVETGNVVASGTVRWNLSHWPGLEKPSDQCEVPPPVTEQFSLTTNTSLTKPQECEGNPCSPITGDKFQTEVDYISSGSSDLTVSRSYSSLGSGRWQHNFVSSLDNTQTATPPTHVGPAAGQSALYNTPDAACTQGWNDIKTSAWNGQLATATVVYEGGDLCAVSNNGQLVTRFKINSTTGAAVGTAPQNLHTLTRANGSRYVFQQSGSDWVDPFNPEVKLIASGTDWIFTDSNQTKETYNAVGQLITITPSSGRSQTLAYDLATGAGGDDNSDTLDQVTDAAGRSLTFVYTDNAGQPRLSSATTPDGNVVYSYDAEGNLNTVAYPDGKGKTYHYEDTSFPHHLTGITDENNIRFATWAYNANGKAISSEHAGGVERGTFTYNADGTTTVTGALGDTRVYHFEVQNGARVVSQITGDQCTTCGNGHMQSRAYDTNGFLSGYTDWNGNQTALVNNARGLTETRSEAVGKPEERITTTDWHSNFNRPTQITEPGRATGFIYDSSGQLLSRTVTATGETRTTTYSYHPVGTNGAGLIASVDGPRTGVSDITTYAYDASDNLISTTNALGHITQITAHDPSGRPTTILDPNGIQTDLSYDARGRLLSITRAVGTAAATTTLAYDFVGQITRITLGDGSFLDYGYDNAHRLTGITDSLGNTITYTLDDMGNRTKAERKDPTAKTQPLPSHKPKARCLINSAA